jgi:hypothetical protein
MRTAGNKPLLLSTVYIMTITLDDGERGKTFRHCSRVVGRFDQFGKPIFVACPMSEEQRVRQQELVKHYDRLRSEKVDPRVDNAWRLPPMDASLHSMDVWSLPRHATSQIPISMPWSAIW